MGHIVAKDIYGALGEKIDNLAVRTPQTKAFHAMLRQLYSPDDAELIVVGYGITSRLLRSAVAKVRAEGLRVGMLRPITLWPFPSKRIAELSERVQGFLVAELSTGMLVDDVRLAVEGRAPVAFHGRWGGAVPSVEELRQAIRSAYPAEGRAS